VKNFQVGVIYEADGYVTVRAKNAEDAKRAVRALAVQMDYGGCEANTDMMPATPDLRIVSGPEEVEEDEDGEGAV
jgi:hypothetical protein